MVSWSKSSPPQGSAPIQGRMRIRELFPRIVLGRHPPGPNNSLTDVPGVLVHTQSVHRPNIFLPSGRQIHTINTGVTTILPRRDWFYDGCHAAIYIGNGAGEMTGSHWINESGIMNSPIVLTNSFAVGTCLNGISDYALQHYRNPENGLADWFLVSVVAETFDGRCNDIGTVVIKPEMIVRAIEEASDAPVQEGNSGGGAGTVCGGLKAGTGNASRVINGRVRKMSADGTTEVWEDRQYTLGVLTQVNFGAPWDIKIGGVPVGKVLMPAADREKAEAGIHPEAAGSASTTGSTEPPKFRQKQKDGSIIVVIATDAPVQPGQLQRIAKRATIGIARAGGWEMNNSGDMFIAFSTADHIPRDTSSTLDSGPTAVTTEICYENTLNALFEATADCTEEAIYNSLCMAEDTERPADLGIMKALDLNKTRALLEKWYCDE